MLLNGAGHFKHIIDSFVYYKQISFLILSIVDDGNHFSFFFFKNQHFRDDFQIVFDLLHSIVVIVVWKCLILLLRRSQVTETHPGAAKVDFSLFISYWGGSQELISILWLVIIERKVVQWVWQHSPIKWTIEIHCWLRLICDVTHTGDGCYWITKQSFSFLSV